MRTRCVTFVAPPRTGTAAPMTVFNTDSSDQQADEFTEPSAGPAPTPGEEAAADRSRGRVDLEQVDEHYHEMNSRGAHVQGEGQIESAER
jgi:hypothetical protein